MRLIGGFLHLDGRPADPARLDAMAAAMVEPGLNPRITRHVDGPVALLTLDFAQSPASEPPAMEGAGSVVLAADLRMDGPEGVADAAGLASVLVRDGVAGLDRLSGDFAFAAWDARDRRLTCARDGFGVRPLFIAHQPGRLFAFASLPRGLHATGLVERVLDEEAVVAHVRFHPLPFSRSLFAGVARLEPGSWLRLGPDSPPVHGRHWRPGSADVGWRRMKPADAAAELSALVTEAVRRRLPMAGPVAAHLSGGLDSSAVTVLAARALRPSGRQLLAYSFVPAPFGPYRFGGEGPYLAPVLRQEPDIVWQPVSLQDPVAAVLPRMDTDQLLPMDPGIPETRIMADAAANGARMLLSGWGGDDGASYGVGSLGVLAEALLTGRWAYLAAELRHKGSARAALGALAGELLSPGQRQTLRVLLKRERPTSSAPCLLSGLLRAGRADAWLHDRLPPPRQARHRRLELIRGPFLAQRAEYWALLGARHGVAVSFPLLDRQVVEFALSLPSLLFLREGWPRRLFRDAMVGVLPPEVCWKRSKRDVTPGVFMHIAGQRRLLLDRLAVWRRSSHITGLFDLDAVEKRLCELPAAEDLARILDDDSQTSLEQYLALQQSSVLLRIFRTLNYLADWD